MKRRERASAATPEGAPCRASASGTHEASKGSSGTTPDVSLNVSVETLAYSVQLTAFGLSEEVLFPATAGVQITEEICIDILDTCEAAEGFTEEDRRLLEDGDYRLLE